MRRPLVIFATAPCWISLYMREILFSFLSVYSTVQYTLIHEGCVVWAFPCIVRRTQRHHLDITQAVLFFFVAYSNCSNCQLYLHYVVDILVQELIDVQTIL